MSYRLLDRGETMQRGDEALADPKNDKWGPIPHWHIGMPNRASNNPVRRVLDVSLDAESVIERLQARIEHSNYFNGVRFARLWHWAHEELSEDLKRRFFSIVANGTADPNEHPNYAQQFNMMKHRAELAEEELAKLRAAYGVKVAHPKVSEPSPTDGSAAEIGKRMKDNAALRTLARLSDEMGEEL